MRILLLNTPLYDFLTATVIEGLVLLQQERGIELVCREPSNYAPRRAVWSRERILRDKGSFDAVVLGTNKNVDRELFDEVAPGRVTACLDGSDSSEFAHPPDSFDVYFKRELARGQASPVHVYPCPFAVERRWRRGRPLERAIFLSACFGPRDDRRRSALEALRKATAPDLVTGPVAAQRWIGLDGVLRRHCSWSVYQQHPFAVGHNHPYHRILRRSRLSLSVPGIGWDTGRWWEILGSGAVIVSQLPGISMPYPFEPGVHFLAYSHAEELPDLIARARAEPANIEALRARAADHRDRYHTSKERARYVLDALMA